MRRATVLLLLLVIPVLTTSAEDQSVAWREVLGILTPGNVVGSGTGAVNGGFLPWTTTLGGARLNLATGHVQFVVKGWCWVVATALALEVT